MIGPESRGAFKKITRGKLSLVIILALILGPLTFLLYQCYYSPDVPFIFNYSGASWIRFPEPISTYTRIYTDTVHFSKDFYSDPDPGGKVLAQFKAFRKVKLYVNGQLISSGKGENWKKETKIEISQWIKPGLNSLRAEVKNPLGPALFWLKIKGLKQPISTDASWKVRIKSSPFVQAISADDTGLNPDSRTVPTPFQSFIKKGKTICWLFLASIGLWGIGHFLLNGRRMQILPRFAFAGVVMVLIFLFLTKMIRMGPAIGFDVSDHLKYILFILETQKIPLASDGWSMFHPPFFYLLSVGSLEIFRLFHFLGESFQVLKIIPFLCGVGNVGVAYALGRMIFREDSVRVFFVVVMAGIIPMNIYMSAYVGNEPLHTFLVGLSLLGTVQILRRESTGFSQMLYLGFPLGLALLTKITAWVLAPIAVIFVSYKMIWQEGKPAKEVAGKLAALLLILGGIAGWYYIRNMVHFGRPFLVNWNLAGQQWWQDPGFHTIRYYLGFGEVLRHPYFSGFHSFWDSIYSTFWGDGLIGGKALLKGRPGAWDYDYMSALYLLGLPATGIFLMGLFRAVQMVSRDKESRPRLVMTFLIVFMWAVGFFILFSTLRVPIYSQAKAFYGLSAIGPISVIFALGLGMVNDWLASPNFFPIRAVFYGWFGTLIGVVLLSFGA